MYVKRKSKRQIGVSLSKANIYRTQIWSIFYKIQIRVIRIKIRRIKLKFHFYEDIIFPLHTDTITCANLLISFNPPPALVPLPLPLDLTHSFPSFQTLAVDPDFYSCPRPFSEVIYCASAFLTPSVCCAFWKKAWILTKSAMLSMSLPALSSCHFL